MQRTYSPINGKKAFSIVEILIAISILVLLAVVWLSSKQWWDNTRDNTKAIADTETINNALEAYSQDNPILPLPGWNNNSFKVDATYSHLYNDAETFWVYGSFTENTLAKKYLEVLPLDPRTNSYYAYGKTKDTNQFEIASVHIVDWAATSKVVWNYTAEVGPYSLIREYNWKDFIYNNSTENFPYNPDELVMTVTTQSWAVYRVWDTIKVWTGEKLEIYFSDGSTAILWDSARESILVLNELDFPKSDSLTTLVKLALWAGTIWTRATNLNEESEFEIYTTDSTAAVRWTEFWVSKMNTDILGSGTGTEILVLEWEVDVVPASNPINDSNILLSDTELEFEIPSNINLRKTVQVTGTEAKKLKSKKEDSSRIVTDDWNKLSHPNIKEFLEPKKERGNIVEELVMVQAGLGSSSSSSSSSSSTSGWATPAFQLPWNFITIPGEWGEYGNQVLAWSGWSMIWYAPYNVVNWNLINIGNVNNPSQPETLESFKMYKYWTGSFELEKASNLNNPSDLNWTLVFNNWAITKLSFTDHNFYNVNTWSTNETGVYVDDTLGYKLEYHLPENYYDSFAVEVNIRWAALKRGWIHALFSFQSDLRVWIEGGDLKLKIGLNDKINISQSNFSSLVDNQFYSVIMSRKFNGSDFDYNLEVVWVINWTDTNNSANITDTDHLYIWSKQNASEWWDIINYVKLYKFDPCYGNWVYVDYLNTCEQWDSTMLANNWNLVGYAPYDRLTWDLWPNKLTPTNAESFKMYYSPNIEEIELYYANNFNINNSGRASTLYNYNANGSTITRSSTWTLHNFYTISWVAWQDNATWIDFNWNDNTKLKYEVPDSIKNNDFAIEFSVRWSSLHRADANKKYLFRSNKLETYLSWWILTMTKNSLAFKNIDISQWWIINDNWLYKVIIKREWNDYTFKKWSHSDTYTDGSNQIDNYFYIWNKGWNEEWDDLIDYVKIYTK